MYFSDEYERHRPVGTACGWNQKWRDGFQILNFELKW